MSCNSTQHLTKNCSLISFYPKEAICLKYHFKEINSERRKTARRKKKSINSRKSQKKVAKDIAEFISKNTIEIKKIRKKIIENLLNVEEYNSYTSFLSSEDENDNLEVNENHENSQEDLDESQGKIVKKHGNNGKFLIDSKIKMKKGKKLEIEKPLELPKRKEEQHLIFDTMKAYHHYFPYNNYTNVLKKLSRNYSCIDA